MSNTPQHYDNGLSYDVIDIIKDYELNFNEGNALKYIVRARKKGAHLQDLRKAINYLEREIIHHETKNTYGRDINQYKITIPKEENIYDEYLKDELKKYKDVKTIVFNKPKQEILLEESLEEAAKKWLNKDGLNVCNHYDTIPSFIAGAKWQQERSYSEEEVLKLWNWLNDGFIIRKSLPTREELIGWFEQFKNK